jgi:DNA (cytosine-5)-methyltransferase 1
MGIMQNNLDMVNVRVNTAEKLTKQLMFKRVGEDKRKLVVSSNWLPLVDFEAGQPTVEISLGYNRGIEIRRVYDLLDAPMKTKMVYSRTYPNRKNKPFETLLDISKQELLRKSFPADCERVHVTFRQGVITIVPLSTKQQDAILNAKTATDKLSVFAALTSGVDIHSMQKNGCTVRTVLEYRPQEARDKTDFTETGVLTVLANCSSIKRIYNEDINFINAQSLADDHKADPCVIFSASPQCDDYSNVKANKLKVDSLTDLSSSIDMSYDLLRIVDSLSPPTALFENVTGWLKSDGYKMLSLRMRRWGYTEHLIKADCRDFGGLTSRVRAYAFFTALPSEFSWEAPVDRNKIPIWDLLGEDNISKCRDVSKSKSINDGLACGRLRVITKKSLHSPSILKSQNRQAKDSCVLFDGEKYLFPTEKVMRILMGIDDSFDLNAVSGTIASEQIGQSVDVPLHDMVMRSVTKHIDAFFASIGK